MEDQAEQIIDDESNVAPGAADGQEAGDAAGAQTPEAKDEGVDVVIEGDPPPLEEGSEAAPPWVKNLREQQRQTARENRELKEKLARLEKPAQAIELGPKPTMQSCDYDEDRFVAELDAWNARKAESDAAGAEREKAAQTEQQAWQQKALRYAEQKKALKVQDYADAESAVEQALSQVQQAIIVKGAENAATIAYALGKSPARLQELAAIKDPVEFAFAVARLETKLKVQPRTAPPPPEDAVKGASPVAGSSDKQLEQLEAEADRSGDRSKVVAYKRKLKQQAA